MNDRESKPLYSLTTQRTLSNPLENINSGFWEEVAPNVLSHNLLGTKNKTYFELFDVSSGKHTKIIHPQVDRVMAIDDENFVSVSTDQIKKWNIKNLNFDKPDENKSVTYKLFPADSASVKTIPVIKMSHDHRFLTGILRERSSAGERFFVWRFDFGNEMLTKIPVAFPVLDIGILPDANNRFILIGEKDAALYEWDKAPHTGKPTLMPIPKISVSFKPELTGQFIGTSADGRFWLTAPEKGAPFCLWSVGNNYKLQLINKFYEDLFFRWVGNDLLYYFDKNICLMDPRKPFPFDLGQKGNQWETLVISHFSQNRIYKIAENNEISLLQFVTHPADEKTFSDTHTRFFVPQQSIELELRHYLRRIEIEFDILQQGKPVYYKGILEGDEWKKAYDEWAKTIAATNNLLVKKAQMIQTFIKDLHRPQGDMLKSLQTFAKSSEYADIFQDENLKELLIKIFKAKGIRDETLNELLPIKGIKPVK